MADSIVDAIKTALSNLVKPTALWYDTSWGLEVAAGRYGATIQGLTIGNDNGEKQSYSVKGVGIGASISPGKVSGSLTAEDFKATTGALVYRGTTAIGAVDFDDLTGLGHIITISGAFLGSGTCVSIMIFNEFIDFVAFDAWMVVAGQELGTTGAGIMVYKVKVSKSDD